MFESWQVGSGMRGEEVPRIKVGFCVRGSVDGVKEKRSSNTCVVGESTTTDTIHPHDDGYQYFYRNTALRRLCARMERYAGEYVGDRYFNNWIWHKSLIVLLKSILRFIFDAEFAQNPKSISPRFLKTGIYSFAFLLLVGQRRGRQ